MRAIVNLAEASVKRTVAVEREACADLAEGAVGSWAEKYGINVEVESPSMDAANSATIWIAHLIRARGDMTPGVPKGTSGRHS